MSLTLAKKALLLLAGPFALLLALLGLVAGLERATADAQHWELRTQEVVAQARRVATRLGDTQGGVRGYVVTADPDFLAPYDAAVTHWPAELDELAERVSDNPPQAARAAELRRLTAEYGRWQAGTVELVRAGNAAGAADRIRGGDGDRQAAVLRAELAAFLAEEDRLAAGRADVVKAARRTLWLLLAGGVAVAAGVTAALGVAFHRGVSRRVDVLVQTTRRLAAGAEPPAPLAGRDEFARIDAAVRAMAAELADANRELAHKNAENEMFVYSVSHDLRAPLVNLQGFAAELDKGCRRLAALVADPGVPPAVRDPAEALLGGKMTQALGFIRAAVLRLSGIIEALLRLSRAGRVEYRSEVVDVAAVVARVVASLHGTVTTRGAAVAVGDLPPAWGDPTALEQVFANLIGNALTYLDPARPGRVEVGCLPETTDGLCGYYVRDNGLGIAEAHRGRIFQAFQRAHPQVAGGEGIGLAVAARVVERHRGRVWVESEAGEGSTFYVALPAAPAGGG